MASSIANKAASIKDSATSRQASLLEQVQQIDSLMRDPDTNTMIKMSALEDALLVRNSSGQR